MRNIFKKIFVSPVPFLIFFSFLLWVYAFRGFIFGQLSLSSDALAYFEHFKYYFDQLRRGVYPMWDFERDGGVPQDFFLRRFGEFNPLHYFILIFQYLGLSYHRAYFFYLATYYSLGMVGFYFLTKIIYRNSMIAFFSFLLLMFSSLGTRLFDSYFLLVFIPGVWFFYFLLAFFKTKNQFNFIGIIFTSMVLVSTYIPFYFLTIFLSFLLFFPLFYWINFKNFFVNSLEFIKVNKFFIGWCLIALIIACIPHFLFYLEGKKGEVVLSERNYAYEGETLKTGNALEVSTTTITKWAILEDIIYSICFNQNLERIKFAVLYIPLFAYILLVLGAFQRVTKRLLFFVFWGGGIFLMGTPDATPLYHFLNDHAFYFKYFRNLHFFLWLILLPLFVLICAELMNSILSGIPKTKLGRHCMNIFIFFVHLGFYILLLIQKNVQASSCVVIIASFLFFILYYNQKLSSRNIWALAFLMLIITAQPMEVYQHLSKGVDKYIGNYRYENPYLFLKLPSEDTLKLLTQNFSPVRKIHPYSSYYSLKRYLFMRNNLDNDVLDFYRGKKIIVYDNVEWMDENNINLSKIESAFAQNKNVAFVSSGSREDVLDGTSSPHADVVFQGSSDVKVLSFDVNYLKLKTNYPTRKFLVYNDNYYEGWKVFVNNKQSDLLRANVTFKGVWLPPGENIVYFKYGENWRYFLAYFEIMLFLGIFILLCFLGIKQDRPPDVAINNI